MEAMTEFGAAFALACSDRTQQLPRVARPLSRRYGLLTDSAERMRRNALRRNYIELSATNGGNDSAINNGVARKAGAKALTVIRRDAVHRFKMSASAAELGASNFGMTQPCENWNTFEGMFTALLALHAHSAVCAASKGIVLAPVPGKDKDPLSPVKAWLRLHAQTATSTLTVTATTAVASRAAARELILRAEREELEALQEAMLVVSLEGGASFKAALDAPDATRVTRMLRVETEGQEMRGANPNDSNAVREKNHLKRCILEKAVAAKKQCAESAVVVVRNAPHAPFADAFVGVVSTNGAGVRVVTHLLLIQLKHFSSEEKASDSKMRVIPEHEENLELYKMGCRSREAVIAFSVARYGKGVTWASAMVMLQNVPGAMKKNRRATLYKRLVACTRVKPNRLNENVAVDDMCPVEMRIVVYKKAANRTRFHDPSDNVLLITDDTKAEAFYPTLWGNDSLSGAATVAKRPKHFDVALSCAVCPVFS